MRPRVYIAGPISIGNLEDNIRQASECFVRLMRAGLAPLCPHWSAYADGVPARAMPAGTRHEDWMRVDLPWVVVADAVLRLPGESVGADLEVEFAKANNVPVFWDENELVKYFKTGRRLGHL